MRPCFIFIALCLSLNTASAVETVALQPGDVMLPQGHRMALYLDCGDEQTEAKDDNLSMTLLSGQAYVFPGISGPLGSAVYDADQVTVKLEGLGSGKDYVLGFTWWDADDSGRNQSVQFAPGASGDWQTVLLPVRAASFHEDKPSWARVLLPITPEFITDGALSISFVREAGPNAVVNELWLLERADSSAVKRVLIVTGDDYAGHDWRATAPALAGALREVEGLEVSVTECPAVFGSPLLAHYDAAVIHFKNYDDRLPLAAACEKGLRDYVASGKGLALCHFACGAFQEWDGFGEIAGRAYNPDLRPHDPYGVFTVRITGEDHPVTRGMKPFEVKDELYTCVDGGAPVKILCDAVSVVDQAAYPMAFITENTGGRVFHCLLGHDAEVYASPGARALYQRGIAWAAGMEY